MSDFELIDKQYKQWKALREAHLQVAKGSASPFSPALTNVESSAYLPKKKKVNKRKKKKRKEKNNQEASTSPKAPATKQKSVQKKKKSKPLEPEASSSGPSVIEEEEVEASSQNTSQKKRGREKSPPKKSWQQISVDPTKLDQPTSEEHHRIQAEILGLEQNSSPPKPLFVPSAPQGIYDDTVEREWRELQNSGTERGLLASSNRSGGPSNYGPKRILTHEKYTFPRKIPVQPQVTGDSFHLSSSPFSRFKKNIDQAAKPTLSKGLKGDFHSEWNLLSGDSGRDLSSNRRKRSEDMESPDFFQEPVVQMPDMYNNFRFEPDQRSSRTSESESRPKLQPSNVSITSLSKRTNFLAEEPRMKKRPLDEVTETSGDMSFDDRRFDLWALQKMSHQRQKEAATPEGLDRQYQSPSQTMNPLLNSITTSPERRDRIPALQSRQTQLGELKSPPSRDKLISFRTVSKKSSIKLHDPELPLAVGQEEEKEEEKLEQALIPNPTGSGSQMYKSESANNHNNFDSRNMVQLLTSNSDPISIRGHSEDNAEPQTLNVENRNPLTIEHAFSISQDPIQTKPSPGVELITSSQVVEAALEILPPAQDEEGEGSSLLQPLPEPGPNSPSEKKPESIPGEVPEIVLEPDSSAIIPDSHSQLSDRKVTENQTKPPEQADPTGLAVQLERLPSSNKPLSPSSDDIQGTPPEAVSSKKSTQNKSSQIKDSSSMAQSQVKSQIPLQMNSPSAAGRGRNTFGPSVERPSEEQKCNSVEVKRIASSVVQPSLMSNSQAKDQDEGSDLGLQGRQISATSGQIEKLKISNNRRGRKSSPVKPVKTGTVRQLTPRFSERCDDIYQGIIAMHDDRSSSLSSQNMKDGWSKKKNTESPPEAERHEILESATEDEVGSPTALDLAPAKDAPGEESKEKFNQKVEKIADSVNEAVSSIKLFISSLKFGPFKKESSPSRTTEVGSPEKTVRRQNPPRSKKSTSKSISKSQFDRIREANFERTRYTEKTQHVRFQNHNISQEGSDEEAKGENEDELLRKSTSKLTATPNPSNLILDKSAEFAKLSENNDGTVHSMDPQHGKKIEIMSITSQGTHQRQDTETQVKFLSNMTFQKEGEGDNTPKPKEVAKSPFFNNEMDELVSEHITSGDVSPKEGKEAKEGSLAWGSSNNFLNVGGVQKQKTTVYFTQNSLRPPRQQHSSFKPNEDATSFVSDDTSNVFKSGITAGEPEKKKEPSKPAKDPSVTADDLHWEEAMHSENNEIAAGEYVTGLINRIYQNKQTMISIHTQGMNPDSKSWVDTPEGSHKKVKSLRKKEGNRRQQERDLPEQEAQIPKTVKMTPHVPIAQPQFQQLPPPFGFIPQPQPIPYYQGGMNGTFGPFLGQPPLDARMLQPHQIPLPAPNGLVPPRHWESTEPRRGESDPSMGESDQFWIQGFKSNELSDPQQKRLSTNNEVVNFILAGGNRVTEELKESSDHQRQTSSQTPASRVQNNPGVAWQASYFSKLSKSSETSMIKTEPPSAEPKPDLLEHKVSDESAPARQVTVQVDNTALNTPDLRGPGPSDKEEEHENRILLNPPLKKEESEKTNQDQSPFMSLNFDKEKVRSSYRQSEVISKSHILNINNKTSQVDNSVSFNEVQSPPVHSSSSGGSHLKQKRRKNHAQTEDEEMDFEEIWADLRAQLMRDIDQKAEAASSPNFNQSSRVSRQFAQHEPSVMTSIALISKSPLEDTSKGSDGSRPLTVKKPSPAMSTLINPIIPESSESSDIKILSNSSRLSPELQVSRDRQNSLKSSKIEIASGAQEIMATQGAAQSQIKVAESLPSQSLASSSAPSASILKAEQDPVTSQKAKCSDSLGEACQEVKAEEPPSKGGENQASSNHQPASPLALVTKEQDEPMDGTMPPPAADCLIPSDLKPDILSPPSSSVPSPDQQSDSEIKGPPRTSPKTDEEPSPNSGRFELTTKPILKVEVIGDDGRSSQSELPQSHESPPFTKQAQNPTLLSIKLLEAEVGKKKVSLDALLQEDSSESNLQDKSPSRSSPRRFTSHRVVNRFEENQAPLAPIKTHSTFGHSSTLRHGKRDTYRERIYKQELKTIDSNQSEYQDRQDFQDLARDNSLLKIPTFSNEDVDERVLHMDDMDSPSQAGKSSGGDQIPQKAILKVRALQPEEEEKSREIKPERPRKRSVRHPHSQAVMPLGISIQPRQSHNELNSPGTGLESKSILTLGSQVPSHPFAYHRQRSRSFPNPSPSSSQVRRSNCVTERRTSHAQKMKKLHSTMALHKAEGISGILSGVNRKLRDMFKRPSVNEIDIKLERYNTIKSELDFLASSREIKIKKDRINHLWAVAKKHVKKLRLIAMLRGFQKRGSVKAQTGELTFEEDKNLVNLYTDKYGGAGEWRCLIKYDSFFMHLWNIILTYLIVVIVREFPLLIGSHNLILLVNLESNMHGIHIFMAVIAIMDVVVNIVSEHQVNDLRKTTKIKESFKYYALHGFIPDILVAVPFILLAFVNQSKVENAIFGNVYYDLVATRRDNLELEELDIIEGFKEGGHGRDRWSSLALKLESSNKDHGFYSNILLFQYFVLLKFVNFSRVLRIMKTYNDFLSELPFLSNKLHVLKSKISTTFKLIHILLKLAIIIHFISGIWMLQSDYIHRRLQKSFISFLSKVNDNSLEPGLDCLKNELWQVELEQFYLITLTLTVVGYGDAISMPDLVSFKNDYYTLLFCMLLGFLGFQQTQAQLSSFLQNIRQIEVSTRSVLLEYHGQLESYFMAHNTLKGATKFQIHDIEVLKDQIEVAYASNFKSVAEDPFFIELTPTLKKQLIHGLIFKEMAFFKFLFFDIIYAENKSHFRQCVSHEGIYKILEHVELQEVSTDMANYDTRVIKSPGKQFTYFYMIKRGRVQCFSPEYQYMFNLEEGSFFGEYNILFNIFNQIHYQAVEDRHNQCRTCQLLKIEKEAFLDIIASELDSFKHIHSLSVQKFRFQQKMLNEFGDRWKRRKAHQIQNIKESRRMRYKNEPESPKKQGKITLFDIIEMRIPDFFKINPLIAQFYSEIKIKRKERLADKRRQIFIKTQQESQRAIDFSRKGRKKDMPISPMSSKRSSPKPKFALQSDLLLKDIAEESSEQEFSRESNKSITQSEEFPMPDDSDESSEIFLTGEKRVSDYLEKDDFSQDINSDDEIDKEHVIGLGGKLRNKDDEFLKLQINQILHAEKLFLENFMSVVDMTMRFQKVRQLLVKCNEMIEKGVVTMKATKVEQVKRASFIQSISKFAQKGKSITQTDLEQIIAEQIEEVVSVSESSSIESFVSRLQSQQSVRLIIPKKAGFGSSRPGERSGVPSLVGLSVRDHSNKDTESQFKRASVQSKEGNLSNDADDDDDSNTPSSSLQ